MPLLTKLAAVRRFVVGDPSVEHQIEDLYASLSAAQRAEVCLPWDYSDEDRGLVRRFIANHWQVTRPCVSSDFFTPSQNTAIANIFKALLDPAWVARFEQAMVDDTNGHPWGQDQSIAILGTPGAGPWQFLFTGRHITLRAQARGSSEFAFGGPVVYGHATSYKEAPGHPGNVFWSQALAASRVHDRLDARTRASAEVERLPAENEIAFRPRPQGAPVSSFSPEAREEFQRLLALIMEPFRVADRKRLEACVDAQGGIDGLSLAFARQPRMSAPVWDVWRIEGPSFVWHFQGWPHVHAWVHVATTPRAGDIRACHGAFLHPEHDPLWP